MKKKVAKKITIDDLAVMVGKGFANVDARFNRVDKRFDGIDNRLDGIDDRLDGIDNRLDGIDGRLNNMDGRFDDVEGRLISIESGNYNRLTKLESTVKIITSVLEKDLKIKLPKSV